MAEAGKESPVCLICHECVLSDRVSALRCGHVYHSHCIGIWIKQGRGECPQCKKITPEDHIRPLDLEVVELLPEPLEEVRRLLADGTDRRGLVAELMTRREGQRRELEELQGECAMLGEEAQNAKRARKELQKKGIPEAQEELALLRETVKKKQQDETDLRNHLDREEMRHCRQLPIADVREDDDDCREEKRKLRAVRKGDRARSLHEAVLSAQQQEGEYRHLFHQRKTDADKAEEELRLLRQQERSLRIELEQLRERRAEGVTRSQSSSTLSQESQRAAAEAVSSATVRAKKRTGPLEPREEREEEDDAIFGGLAKARRPQAGGLAILGAGTATKVARAPATPAASLAAPVRAQTGMKALFSKQQA